ncbi:MAG: BLUF domain-containing protein [Gammaproteobacteria bacterium]|nr:BLUF domain-containing protein [Gammaproteobacteria bacterium]
MLVRLIYTSRVTNNIEATVIKDILRVSEQNNMIDNVSGVLLFSSSYFLQLLEGPRRAVNRAYARILVDKRHEDACMIRYEPIVSRQFGQWRMGYIGEGIFNKEVLFKYTTDGKFDPYSMSPDSALDLLLELLQRSVQIKS